MHLIFLLVRRLLPRLILSQVTKILNIFLTVQNTPSFQIGLLVRVKEKDSFLKSRSYGNILLMRHLSLFLPVKPLLVLPSHVCPISHRHSWIWFLALPQHRLSLYITPGPSISVNCELFVWALCNTCSGHLYFWKYSYQWNLSLLHHRNLEERAWYVPVFIPSSLVESGPWQKLLVVVGFF